MNATSLDELRSGGLRRARDEQLEQVRELLFGDAQRQMEDQAAAIDTRLRELEAALHRRLDALEARLEALAGEVEADRRSAIEEIGRGLKELGDNVQRLSRG